MTTQTPPWPPVIVGQTSRLVSNIQTWRSPLTGKAQMKTQLGSRWEFDVQFGVVTDSRAADWWGFLTNCQDQALPFYWSFYPKGLPAAYTTGWDAGTPSWGATPLVNGASQTGWSIAVDGLTVGATFKRGDSIAFTNGTFRELHVITADTTANGSGQATFPITPQIRISPADNATVYFDGDTADVTKRAACEVWFADPKQAAKALSGFQTNFSLKLVEFLQ